jgi:sialate O-acetylesterase
MKLLPIILYLLPLIASSQLTIDQPMMDHMVLQRGHVIRLSGKAIPNTTVQVRLGEYELYEVTTGSDATWECMVPAHKSNPIPFSLQIEMADQRITYKDLVFGDVWLCAGQSNMEFPFRNESHFKDQFPIKPNHLIRVYSPTYVGKQVAGKKFSDSMMAGLNAKDFFKGNWQPLDNATAPDFSAVGFYFSDIVQQRTGIPVGVINIAVGGSPIEAWMSPSTFMNHPLFSKKADANWLVNQDLPVWVRQRAMENIGDQSPNFSHAFQPSFIFEASVKSLMKLPIAGILWYQGESNAQEMDRVEEYAQLQSLMVEQYRMAWKLPELPFYFVQLSSIDSTSYKSQYWPLFRANQMQAYIEGHHMGIVASMDKGAPNDVHPRDKMTIATRLTNWALHDVYGFKDQPTVTVPLKAKYQNQQVVITFSNNLNSGEAVLVKGFSLDGKTEISARIEKNKIVLIAPGKPKKIIYGFSPYTSANLIDNFGIPVPGFILDLD